VSIDLLTHILTYSHTLWQEPIIVSIGSHTHISYGKADASVLPIRNPSMQQFYPSVLPPVIDARIAELTDSTQR